jgi:Uma2 family endonuclease
MIAEPRERLGMPMDEFIAQFDKAPFEYIDGEVKPLMPTVFIHSWITKFFYDLLHELEKQVSIVVFSETTFVMMPNPNWVTGSRVPDVMVYERARLVEYQTQQPEAGQLPLILVPDLCVEVISQTDQYSEVLKKVRGYLRDGVRIVWLVDPSEQTVAVYTQGSQQSTLLSGDDMLDGGAVVAGFSVRVGDVFAAKI